MRHLVLYNQVMIGSVNANREHFRLAIDDLEQMHHTWPDAIKKVITHRLPYDQFDAALHQHAADEIKTVIKWDGVKR